MRIASNKLKDIIDFAYQELDLLYEKNEIRSMIYSLIEHFTEFDLTKILTYKDELKVSESELLKINFAIKDLKKEKPLQQIIGYTDFLDVRIDVNEHVLIPRVETEEIVQRVINENKGRKNLKIADICCGSGCIAIALKKAFPDANIYAYDISEEALKKSKENAEKNKEKINFFKENILESKEKNQEFDIIVSNPPYVRESEKAFMRNNVLLYEPALALFVSDKEPLIFYEHLLKFSNQNLAKNGKIYMEINENLAKETELLFKNFNYQTSVFKDLRGKDRLLLAKKDW
ncbi:MAG: peptide chain release factor N(5)-glutamine methyltransferase [Bacteroidales bacterium]|nr:peptide chain release factor N(5)-glutamine methyltransferase [Bacteroidales bacterium]MEE1220405.1 peptide chain release factor N(5)-glutamine methyltransferase [Bacteroidales bacterium]MEE1322186.1 peptide chain release factor N(5)-glutamine methyltransferase [Bacteroidales bacterium]